MQVVYTATNATSLKLIQKKLLAVIILLAHLNTSYCCYSHANLAQVAPPDAIFDAASKRILNAVNTPLT